MSRGVRRGDIVYYSRRKRAVDGEALFGLSVLLSFCAFGIVRILCILPPHRSWAERTRSQHWLFLSHSGPLGSACRYARSYRRLCHQLSRCRRHMAISLLLSLR